MPAFSKSDKAAIATYVADRLAAGDKAGDIHRDLTAHWAAMDNATAATTTPEPTAPELPPLAPTNGNGSVPRHVLEAGGGTPGDWHHHSPSGAPVTLAEIAGLRSQGMSWAQIAQALGPTGRK